MACPPFEMQVVAWWRRLGLLAAAMLSINAHADRITESEARSNMHVAAHSIGLEFEHDLSIGWPLEGNDRQTLHNILEKLNTCNDSEWQWEDETRTGWRFPLVNWIRGGPRRNLALHMLNRHGLAARIAAEQEEEFDTFFRTYLHTRGYDQSVMKTDKIQAADWVTEALEVFPPVEKLLNIMKDELSLSGLRNMHSYDHAWAQKKSFGEGCPEAQDECVLQAGTSPAVHGFMDRHNFIKESIRTLGERLDKTYIEGLQKLTEASLKAKEFFAPTILNNIIQLYVRFYEMKGSGVSFEAAGNTMSGKLTIEDTIHNMTLSFDIKFPVLDDDKAKVVAADTAIPGELFVRLFHRYLDEKVLHSHNEFMWENRVHVWAGENADFAAMQPTPAQKKQLQWPGDHSKAPAEVYCFNIRQMLSTFLK